MKRLAQSILALEIVVILVVSALAYLPFINRATFYRDDWYYVMDRTLGGPGTFQEMFRIDRPARGPFFEAYYQLFGIQPLPYHVSGFLWRLLVGLAGLWLFRLLWPGRRGVPLTMALLLVLYPGFTIAFEAFEIQPPLASLFLQIISIGLTLEAVRSARPAARAALWAGSILTGWAYLALIDYAIGMEIFRLLCVYLFLNREPAGQAGLQRWAAALRAALPAGLIAGGFLFWRLFIFQNERTDTDISLQLGRLAEAPAQVGVLWLARWFQSTANTALLAWTAPLNMHLFALRMREILAGFFLAGLAAAIVAAVYWLYIRPEEARNSPGKEEVQSGVWQHQAVWIGLVGVVFGVLPVVIANRYIFFERFSHYTVPASLASAVLVGGLIYGLRTAHLRTGVLSALVLVGVLVHFGSSGAVVHEQEKISRFWHQMAWRAPGLREGTTLLVTYPDVGYGEDIDAVNGPANFLYFPEPGNQLPVRYGIYSLPRRNGIGLDLLVGENIYHGYRTHTSEIRYDQLLVISQPTVGSCVHVIDNRWPRLSDKDDRDLNLLASQFSTIDAVLTTGPGIKPPRFLFGPEPSRDWCYYYQKAELALQMEDWNLVVEMGEQAFEKALRPVDRVEWMPFIQAYALAGNQERVSDLGSRINDFPFLRLQACKTLTAMQQLGHDLTPQMASQVDDLFCWGFNR